MKQVDSKIRAFLPELSNKGTWEKAWELMSEKAGLEIDSVYDQIRPDKKRLLTIQMVRGAEEYKLLKFQGQERLKYVTDDNEFNDDELYKMACYLVVNDKLIKKPRNGQQIKQKCENELKELRRQRDNLTMRINAWKKTGKDTTILEQQKDMLNKQIKSMA